MPVARWLSDIFDIMNWMEEGEDAMEELLLQPTITRVYPEDADEENALAEWRALLRESAQWI